MCRKVSVYVCRWEGCDDTNIYMWVCVVYMCVYMCVGVCACV